MEARSLAPVNLLAGNPPQYPIDAGNEEREPLTLYISRVPGTRDVILSPFKPQVKNVTNEDVSSSLYYVHLELPRRDSELAGPQPIREDEFRSSSEESASARAIPRKPLPRNARPITPEDPSHTASHLEVPHEVPGSSRQRGLSVNSYGSYDGPPPSLPPIPKHESSFAPSLPPVPLHDSGPSPYPPPRPSYDSGPPHQPPKPMHDSGVGLPDARPPPPEPFSVYAPEAYHEPPLSRKPVGPRPMSNLYAPAPDKTLPPLPRDHYPPEEGRPGPPWGGVGGDRSSRSPSPRTHGGSSPPNAAPFTLALIRRDPSSGNQWNVGQISSQQTEPAPMTHEYLPTPSPSPSVTRPPIDITIETSGYAKFRNMPTKRSLDVSKGHSPSNHPGRSAEDVTHQGRVEQGLFSRQVVMAYSKSWTSTLMDKWSKKTHSRNASKASASSVGSLGEQGEQGMKPRGYVFKSPWDGSCEFRTGNGGRSVRCHHVPYEESVNPLTGDQEGERAVPTAVSELRFNLPSSELFGASDPDKESKSQWRGHFSKLMGGGDEDDDAVSPFDVNVGAERAGGGNRGKRAKLGKLIVYNDGLKMLDLVVAANVGVWWGAWERNF